MKSPKTKKPTRKYSGKGKSKTQIDAGKPHYCSLIKLPERTFDPTVSADRAMMIIITGRKWVNGTKLKYYFFNGGSDGSPSSWKGDTIQKNAVKNAFDTWKNVGIGILFEETNDRNEAQIRIGFQRTGAGAGSWSYVGRDNIDIATSPDERTMNIGWDISQDIDTAVHEIGHALGAPHEHQNPNAGIVWNDEAVYTELGGPPNNWSRDKTFHNIIRKLPVSDIEGSTHDPNSIMHYPFGPGLIVSPPQFASGISPAGGLSIKDKEYMKRFYPPLTARDYIDLKESQSAMMDILPGEQKNFKFKPTRSRKYTIETFGTMDTVMVLFEKSGTQEIYLSGDDDSGTVNNSKIIYRLIKGREYIIRIRLYYKDREGSGSVMVY